MALGGIYETGTVTIAGDRVSVTGVGTLWSPIVEIGDWLFINGQVGLVGAVVDDTHLTLETQWQGTLPSASVYVIIKMSWLRYDPALTQAKVRELLEHLQAEGHFLFVEGDAPDPGMGEDGQWALKTDTSPWEMWFKTGGVWVEQAPPGGTTSIPVVIAEGGSGATTAQGALTNFGLPKFISAANYATLQLAADALPAANGILFIPPGVYSGTINLGIRNHTTIIGYGAQITLPAGAASGAAVISAGDGVTVASNIKIVGVFLNGNKTNQTNPTHGIYLHGIEYPWIDSVEVTSCKGNGILLKGEAAANNYYPTITNCYITTNDLDGVYAQANTYGVMLTNSTISGNGKTPAGGAGFLAFSNDTHVITGNIFDENENGVTISSCSSCTVSDNAFINNDRSGVIIQSSDHCSVNENNIQSPSMEAADTYYGILTNGTYGDFIGNSIWGRFIRMAGGIVESAGANFNKIAFNQVHNAVNPITIVGAQSRSILNSVDGAATPLAENVGGTGVSIVPRFSAFRSAAQSITAATLVKIAYDSEAFDLGGYFDTTLNRWTPPAGKYQISASIVVTTVLDQQENDIIVRKNTTNTLIGQVYASGANGVQAFVCGIVDMNGTDYLEVYAFCAGTGTKNVAAVANQTFFMGALT